MSSYSPDETYALDDLKTWDYEGTSLAVVGFPVRHSISPAMHNATLRAMRQEHARLNDWKYFRFEIPPEELPGALPEFHSAGFFGLNLTVPHKEIAFSELIDIDPPAQRIRAVNTLRRKDESYQGFNTDGFGLESGIRIGLKQDIAHSHVALIGAGGAGRAAAFQCIESGCSSLAIINRNKDRLEKLINDLQPFADEKSVPLMSVPSDSDYSFQAGTLYINATSLGLKATDRLPIDPDIFQTGDTVFDMIYNPEQTALMKAAASKGCATANGLDMLVYQGVKALQIWTDSEVPDSVMAKAAREALS